MKNILVALGNAGTYVLTALQTNEIFQTISLIASIVTSCVLIAYRVWKWSKEAKADGKITKEEVEDLIEIVKDGVEDFTKQDKEWKDKLWKKSKKL